MRALRLQLKDSYQPGDQLPNEQVLAESFGVSRVTIREAVSRLTAERVLEKRWGVGTFVIDPQPRDSFGLVSFRPGVVASLGAAGGTVTLSHSSMSQGPPNPAVFSDFPGSPTMSLERVYALDGVPAVLVRDLMILRHGDDEIDFGDGDWMKLLIPDLFEQIGLSFTQLTVRLSARFCDDDEARLLKTSKAEPIMSTSGQALDDHGRVLLVVSSTVRTAIAEPIASSHLSFLESSI